jgi:hypothetical protein
MAVRFISPRSTLTTLSTSPVTCPVTSSRSANNMTCTLPVLVYDPTRVDGRDEFRGGAKTPADKLPAGLTSQGLHFPMPPAVVGALDENQALLPPPRGRVEFSLSRRDAFRVFKAVSATVLLTAG